LIGCIVVGCISEVGARRIAFPTWDSATAILTDCEKYSSSSSQFHLPKYYTRSELVVGLFEDIRRAIQSGSVSMLSLFLVVFSPQGSQPGFCLHPPTQLVWDNAKNRNR
jgi:hypothetical protein